MNDWFVYFTIVIGRKEEIEKRQAAERERMERFKERVEAKLISHFEDSKNTNLKFEPMDHVYRSIMYFILGWNVLNKILTLLFYRHEVAENQGLITYAFGTDGVDRYIRVYRKDNPPCEDELAARRRGDPWNDQVKAALIEKVRLWYL